MTGQPDLSTHPNILLRLRLGLLIARAGQNDSLQWWDDNSLTQHGRYVLERIFPAKPTHSGLQLALRAAFTRHHVALVDIDDAIHLYQLEKKFLYASIVQSLPSLEAPDLLEPISDADALHERLLKINNKQPAYEIIRAYPQTGGLQIALAKPATNTGDKALALSWAYLEGEPGRPVFPFMVE